MCVCARVVRCDQPSWTPSTKNKKKKIQQKSDSSMSALIYKSMHFHIGRCTHLIMNVRSYLLNTSYVDGMMNFYRSTRAVWAILWWHNGDRNPERCVCVCDETPRMSQWSQWEFLVLSILMNHFVGLSLLPSQTTKKAKLGRGIDCPRRMPMSMHAKSVR